MSNFKKQLRLKRGFFLISLAFITFGFTIKSGIFEDYKTIVPGVGFDQFAVGVTTKTDIVKACGKSYIKHQYPEDEKEVFSRSMEYKELGIEFYFFPKQKTIFAIHVKAPFKGKTTDGIVLSKSTFRDVKNIYEDANWGLAGQNIRMEIPGITFLTTYRGTIPVPADFPNSYLDSTITGITISTGNY